MLPGEFSILKEAASFAISFLLLSTFISSFYEALFFTMFIKVLLYCLERLYLKHSSIMKSSKYPKTETMLVKRTFARMMTTGIFFTVLLFMCCERHSLKPSFQKTPNLAIPYVSAYSYRVTESTYGIWSCSICLHYFDDISDLIIQWLGKCYTLKFRWLVMFRKSIFILWSRAAVNFSRFFLRKIYFFSQFPASVSCLCTNLIMILNILIIFNFQVVALQYVLRKQIAFSTCMTLLWKTPVNFTPKLLMRWKLCLYIRMAPYWD